MKALALAALLILGSTASATTQSKFQALMKKYGPDGNSVTFAEAIEKAKVLCLCHDAGINNKLGAFVPFASNPGEGAEGGCLFATFGADGNLAGAEFCTVFDVLGR